MDRRAQALKQFEADRPRLRGVALRLLGSAQEAEDAVQEAWLRLQAAEPAGIDNLGAWLTTVVSRISIDMLRARNRRQAFSQHHDGSGGAIGFVSDDDPEEDVVRAESVGLALMVVLDRLRPAERVAFVLHDMFALPFGDIASVLDCSTAAARQLASRGRRAVQGRGDDVVSASRARRSELVQAFFAASRGGDMAALLQVLDADVTLTVDQALGDGETPEIVRGAQRVARRARFGAGQHISSRVILVNGRPGIVVVPGGNVQMVLTFVTSGSRITAIDILADPSVLDGLDLALLPEPFG